MHLRRTECTRVKNGGKQWFSVQIEWRKPQKFHESNNNNELKQHLSLINAKPQLFSGYNDNSALALDS